MDEREFVQSRQSSWERLTNILRKVAAAPGGVRALHRDELRDLGPLYRRAATDLAYARTHAVSGALIGHLNGLVARSFGILFEAETRNWSGLRTFFSRDFPCAFRRRLPQFAVAVAATAAGFGIAYALVRQDRGALDMFVPPGHQFRSSLDQWMSGDVAQKTADAQSVAFASFLMTNNIRVSFAAFALGIAGGALTVALLFQNGLLLGAFAAMVAHVGQTGTFWPGIVPHGVVELSQICIAAAAGISLGWALLAPGPYRRRDALVVAARDSVQLVLGGIALLVFAGLVEAFLSHSALPRAMKVAFGAATGVALYAYLFGAGRSTAASAPSPPSSG